MCEFEGAGGFDAGDESIGGSRFISGYDMPEYIERIFGKELAISKEDVHGMMDEISILADTSLECGDEAGLDGWYADKDSHHAFLESVHSLWINKAVMRLFDSGDIVIFIDDDGIVKMAISSKGSIEAIAKATGGAIRPL